MVFNCPQFTHINVSVFIVLKRFSMSSLGKWAYIVGNDDGSYDKFIGYTSGSLTQLSYVGGWPAKEYKCTIPNNINTLRKHLISCHWLMSGSPIRVNNIVSTDSEFTSNIKLIGAPFSSIFANERFNSSPESPLVADIYGLRVVSGFLEPKDINAINIEMMAEYGIQ